MDDVKRLLEEFADRAVDGLPPADVDADVARGRRALRRIKARRRVTGVLCIAATTAVLAVGNQLTGSDGGETEVATDTAGTAGPSPMPTPSATPAQSGETMSLFSDAAIELVPNRQTWSTIGCTLAPQGWTPEPPLSADRVVLTPPSARTSEAGAKMVLQASAKSQSLASVRSLQADGKVLQVGTAGGRSVGQVKLDERWLVVQLPVSADVWTDDVLRRFIASCSFR